MQMGHDHVLPTAMVRRLQPETVGPPDTLPVPPPVEFKM